MLDFKNKLCIFDCDGTLVDTEPLVAKSWKIFLKKYFNVNFTENDFFEYCHGDSTKNVVKNLNDRFKINLDYRGKIKEKKRTITQDLIKKELKPIPSVTKFLEKIKSFKKCITSNSSKKKIWLSVNVSKLNKYFNENEIFSRDLVENGTIAKAKPAPDMYLYTAEQMKYKPENCIVFEDSIPGLQAAKSAGIKAIGCITPSCKDKVNMRRRMEEVKADYIVENMMEILKL
jgi:beta-phosphoglucomutase-like phosphatase (HAD superfamily)